MRLGADEPPAPTLALVAAVALHGTLSQFTPALQIKWPNDLMAGGAKLAGILLERSGDAVVIGFGANLAHHPADIGRPAVSIRALAGSAPSPAVVVERLAESLASWVSLWRTGGLDPIRRAWLKAAHPLGTRLSTSEGEGAYDGLDESGALLLKLADGSLRTIHAGDVFLV